MRIFDMHCHLDFADDAQRAAREAAARGIGCFSVTVTPQDYEAAVCELEPCENVRVGLGLHPWWVADGLCGEDDIALFERLAASTAFIGEVGLDFGARRSGTEDAQVAAFERVLSACAAGGKVLSVHAVKAEDAVLDLLERQALPEGNACILHWFSGSSDQLQRAIALGCFFSVGPRMVASKRGREYAKAIPLGRLLLETDAPPQPGSAIPYGEIETLLVSTLEAVELLRGEGAAARIAQTSERLLGGRIEARLGAV